MPHLYALGFGSNRYRHGPPRRTIARALEALEAEAVAILARSSIVATRPLGAGVRDFANAAALAQTDCDPAELLSLCKAIERRFGRRAGRVWGDRALDIDLLLWSGGSWSDAGLTLPHPALRERAFVLDPLAAIAPDWRDPVTGLSIRQLRHRLHRPKPVDRRPHAA